MENDNILTVRINSVDLDSFKNKSINLGKPYQLMIREIIKAFNEDRLRITLTDEQEESLKIYQPLNKKD